MASRPMNIAIVGAGTIGLSFAALHLSKNPTCQVIVYDSRLDLETYASQRLPGYLVDADHDACVRRLSFANSLQDAVKDAYIVQEQGPEDPAFKTWVWSEIEQFAPTDALFWSSTSGIPASEQSKDMKDKTRLVVVHPYNPPHIMPLLEIVRSPLTSYTVVDRTVKYWRALGRSPVVLWKDCTGFVANRLAFALFREACSLVTQGVVDVKDLDEIVKTSMGPRWAVAGPFQAYHAGGGEDGLQGFMDKIGGTIDKCWKASDADVQKGNINVGESWQDSICRQAQDAYGVTNTAERDRKTRKVIEAVKQ